MTGGRRHTDAPSFAQTCTIIDAVLYSFCAATWLNRSITIHFAKGGVRPRARALLKYYLKHAGDWLNKRAFGPIHYVYVFENPENGGEHVHILMHVPYGLWRDFVKAEQRWIEAGLGKLGGEYHQKVLVDEPVYQFAQFTKGSANLDKFLKYGLRNSLLYLLKGSGNGILPLLGIDEDEAKRLSKRLRPSPQGYIIGKRVGFSQSLSHRRHIFPGRQLRQGMWMAGPEARSRAILRDLGLEFTAAAVRGRPAAPKAVSDDPQRRSR